LQGKKSKGRENRQRRLEKRIKTVEQKETRKYVSETKAKKAGAQEHDQRDQRKHEATCFSLRCGEKAYNENGLKSKGGPKAANGTGRLLKKKREERNRVALKVGNPLPIGVSAECKTRSRDV